MPSRPKPYCGHHGCGTRVSRPGMLCSRHRTKRVKVTEQGYGARWRKIRGQQPITPCVSCGTEWEQGFHLDHKESRRERLARGIDPDAPSNLQWMCPSCHSSKTFKSQQHIPR